MIAAATVAPIPHVTSLMNGVRASTGTSIGAHLADALGVPVVRLRGQTFAEADEA